MADIKKQIMDKLSDIIALAKDNGVSKELYEKMEKQKKIDLIDPILVETQKCYRKIRRYNEQIRKMEERIESQNSTLISTFVPILQEVYDSWVPKVGERVMHIDFKGNYAMILRVSFVDGARCKAEENPRCGHWFSLDLEGSEKYDASTFILPMNFFNSIRNDFDFNTIRGYGEE